MLIRVDGSNWGALPLATCRVGILVTYFESNSCNLWIKAQVSIDILLSSLVQFWALFFYIMGRSASCATRVNLRTVINILYFLFHFNLQLKISAEKWKYILTEIIMECFCRQRDSNPCHFVFQIHQGVSLLISFSLFRGVFKRSRKLTLMQSAYGFKRCATASLKLLWPWASSTTGSIDNFFCT